MTRTGNDQPPYFNINPDMALAELGGAGGHGGVCRNGDRLCKG